MSQLTPDTPVQYLKGVGPRLAELLQKRSIYTAWDMLFYLPFKYVDRRSVHSVRDLPVANHQTFIATVATHTTRILGRTRRRVLELLVRDETDGDLVKILFFQFHEKSLLQRFPEGTRVLFHGDVKWYNGFKSVVHPEMEVWEDDPEDAAEICPFYPLTEGLHQKTVRRIFKNNLESLVELVEDDPRSVRENAEVALSLKEAFLHLHRPPLDSNVAELNEQKSRHHQRVIYDEFFYLQLGLLSKRYKNAKKPAILIPHVSTLTEKVLHRLPFELTQAQNDALADIYSDFGSGHPMNRLLQGDVGSGKTLVAFLASLVAIESKIQVAFMAPTEILAEQHFKKLIEFEDDLGIKIELLTGSTPEKRRRQILGELRTGGVDLLIGTHALIEPEVVFVNLGFVIIDEQHRFGVEQRSKLKNKTKSQDGAIVPHLLAMTATPIPRTLSMSLYGDLDLSVMREMPKGRQPIDTKVFWEAARERMYAGIEKQLKAGRQVYFVYPLIEESEKLDLKDAKKMHGEISNRFTGFNAGLMHGRLPSAEKEQIMELFKRGEIKILVATTVVEVGVDVPNATVMVVEHAERFGLSQLHQLRGRVGRGAEKSFCCLMAGYKRSQESQYRLRVMEETQDGFVIAEEDLKIRGPGEFLGTKQSGLPDFRLAHLVRDGHLLKAAKKRAEEILMEDAELIESKNASLKKIMLHRWGQRLELVLA